MIRDLLLSVVFEKRYLPIRLLGCSESCKRQYRSNIRRYGKHLGHPARLSDLRDERLSGFFDALLGDGKSFSTVNTIRKQLVSLWRFCAQRRFVKRFPQVRRMSEPKRRVTAFTVEQLGRLLFECAQEVGEIGGMSAAAWLLALFYVLWDTAERRGAVLQIRREDVDLAAGTILVRAESRKGKKSDRLYKLSADTMERLKIIWLPERELLFAFDRHWTTLYNRLKRIKTRCGLPQGRRWGLHAVRRSHASYLKVGGGDPQASLDHESAATTRLYLSPDIVGEVPPSSLLPRLRPLPPPNDAA